MNRELLCRRAAIDQERGGRGGSNGLVDDTIRASWDRCAQLVDAGRDQAPVDATDEIADRWAASPIRRPQAIERCVGADAVEIDGYVRCRRRIGQLVCDFDLKAAVRWREREAGSIQRERRVVERCLGGQ